MAKKPKDSNGSVFVLSMRVIKSIAAAIVTLSFLAGAAVTIDARYASAESVKQLGVKVEMISLINRKAQIEDKLFELQQKKVSNRTERDEALIKRYERQLDEVNREMDKLNGK